jgi:putative membrane protein
MFKYSLLSAAALLSACGNNDNQTATDAQRAETASAETAPIAPAAAPGAPTDAPGYIAKAGAGDLWEIESSKALLAKSARADVKKFAEMMIDHHGKSTAKVKAAAAAASVTVSPPVLDAAQQASLREIKDADAATIDGVYLRHQQTAHDAALALHRAYATNGDTANLKTAASEIVPVVEQHIAELQKLSAAAGSNSR